MTRARRGWAYLGESSKLALHDFDEAIKLDPRDSDLYNGRGYARALLGDFSGAVADAEQALRLGGAGLELRARLALNYNAACIYARPRPVPPSTPSRINVRPWRRATRIAPWP